MIMKKIYTLLVLILIVAFTLAGLAIMSSSSFRACSTFGKTYEEGDTLDSYNGIPVIYNGSFSHTDGRHLATDGYNYGLRWQCVEFVKRYYYDELNHKMPDTYGHAKDFFDITLSDGALNKQRNLKQYKNGSRTKPKPNDIVVFDKNMFNPYGHVAIIVAVTDKGVTVIQQNVGKDSRATFRLSERDGFWTIDNNYALGWLSK